MKIGKLIGNSNRFKTMPSLDDHPTDMGPLLPAVVAAQK
jgi:hypothetical protein